MVTTTFLPLVEDPPLAWTGQGEGGGDYPHEGEYPFITIHKYLLFDMSLCRFAQLGIRLIPSLSLRRPNG